jgi:hypothetical protein
MDECSCRIVCSSSSEWSDLWNQPLDLSRSSSRSTQFRDIAHYVGGVLSTLGFQLFENGGLPLIERYVGAFHEEILLVPAPAMARRVGLPFGVRIHLSSADVSRVRGRFWRPPTRAPHVVAVGDLGELGAPDRHLVWLASEGLATGRQLAQELVRTAVPWFDQFADPARLKGKLYSGHIPLIDDCTALELLLAAFDPYEARRYLRLRLQRSLKLLMPIEEPSGFELSEDRLAPIAAYYRL